MADQVKVETRYAPCGCASVLMHSRTCVLVHDAAAAKSAEGRQIFCDTEDGCVWLHVGDTVAPMTPQAARELGDLLHTCAREAIRG